jgi:hypothetical protein
VDELQSSFFWSVEGEDEFPAGSTESFNEVHAYNGFYRRYIHEGSPPSGGFAWQNEVEVVAYPYTYYLVENRTSAQADWSPFFDSGSRLYNNNGPECDSKASATPSGPFVEWAIKWGVKQLLSKFAARPPWVSGLVIAIIVDTLWTWFNTPNPHDDDFKFWCGLVNVSIPDQEFVIGPEGHHLVAYKTMDAGNIGTKGDFPMIYSNIVQFSPKDPPAPMLYYDQSIDICSGWVIQGHFSDSRKQDNPRVSYGPSACHLAQVRIT